MILTTFNNRALALFLPEPNWSATVALEMVLGAQVDQALSGRENRRPAHALPRWSISCKWTLTRAQALAWTEGSLLLDADTLLAIPAPFDRISLGAGVAPQPDWILDPRLVALWDDAGDAQILSREAFDALASSLLQTPKSAAPLICGRLRRRPEVRVLNNHECEFTLELEETSPDWAALAAALPPAESPVSVDWPPTLPANWRELPTEAIEDLTATAAVGAGREPAVESDAAPWRTQKFLVTLEGRRQIRALLAFFAARKGPVQSWVVPWLLTPSQHDESGTPHYTRARFAADTLHISFTTGSLAEATIEIIQLPWEISLNENETPEQPAVAYLYRLTADIADGPVIWRYTDWESALERDENGTATYAPARIEHDTIACSIDLSDDEVMLTAWLSDAGQPSDSEAPHPLALIVRRALDAPLRLEIFRCDPGAPAHARQLFSGTIAEVTIEGRKLSATASILGGKLDVKVPRFYFGKTCNHTFGGWGCGIAAPSATATITAIADATHLTIAITDAPDALDLSQPSALTGAWFAVGAGLDMQLRAIAADDTTGDERDIVLTRPLRDTTALVGATVTLRLSCGKTIADCARWGNTPNFGGHPQMGPQNLSIPTRETSPAGGKK
jgi:hypothetical protein